MASESSSLYLDDDGYVKFSQHMTAFGSMIMTINGQAIGNIASWSTHSCDFTRKVTKFDLIANDELSINETKELS